MIKTLFKLVLWPFLAALRLIFFFFKLFFVTQLLVTSISLLLLAALAFYVFNTDSDMIARLMNTLRAG